MYLKLIAAVKEDDYTLSLIDFRSLKNYYFFLTKHVNVTEYPAMPAVFEILMAR